MKQKFNDTGLCIPRRHYMADTSAKITQILKLVDNGEYFTINRPRQCGKTTILSLLANKLNFRDDYIALNISFEDIDTETYRYQDRFIVTFLEMLAKEFEYLSLPEQSRFLEQQCGQITNMPCLSNCITTLVRDRLPKKAVVLLIDEVDKSANNQLFLDFLSMLRKKYLQRNQGKDYTFESVILTGVHDVKTLKAKIQSDDKKQSIKSGHGKYNSPWNIAADFEVDLNFERGEIEVMLKDYCKDNNIQSKISAIAEKLYYYSSGYPWLVSKLCKFIDEKIMPQKDVKNLLISDVEQAFTMIVDKSYTTTLFESMIKNLENNQALYNFVYNIVISGNQIPFDIEVPIINRGHLYGIIKNSAEGCQIHNRIFEQRIYSYMMTKSSTSGHREWLLSLQHDYDMNEGLNVRLILIRFQKFMKEHYSDRDAAFLEREGRLLFLSYLRPIINGKGFDFKEPNIADERRMDIVITYLNQRYVLELKIWRGNKCHQIGLKQLSGYLDKYSLKQGYLLIFDFNKNKAYKQEDIICGDKNIFAVWV
jgi:hypothetical protein